MTHTKLTSEIKKLVKDSTIDKIAYAYDYHMLPMVKYSLQLAELYKADREIVEIAAWLHDITWLKGDFSDNHNITSADFAVRYLTKKNYSKAKTEKIKNCILEHRATMPIASPESEAIAGGDALSHFDALPALFYFCYHNQKMSIEEARKYSLSKFQRDWKKLKPEAKNLVKDKHKLLLEILGNN